MNTPLSVSNGATSRLAQQLSNEKQYLANWPYLVDRLKQMSVY